ncbi:phosphotriesterase family protein [Testudinibacter sp. TR-2022]|uniref:phosphotriesterase family protein n=1 Tax=Testudinibacter sp. TR-2022 TaxID=2585029 RepID=UPI00159BB393|nr:phosphotriesterase-related protein [Testudinibacter sp. TR-2022]
MGYTLMHEHIYLDLSKVKNNDDCLLNSFELMVEEFKYLKTLGVERIVDVTNIGMGRNIPYVEQVQLQSCIEIISATGCYKTPFLPDWFYQQTIEQIAQRFIDEIEQGIENSGRKARIIGEVGSGFEGINPDEHRLLQAAALAALATDKYVTTHTSLGRFGEEQLDLFVQMGLNSDRVIIGHTDLAGDRDYLFRLLDRGAYVEFDTIGKLNYQSDELRADLFSQAVKCGYQQQLLLSVDITRKSHLRANGGIGYAYLFEQFIPLLFERGVTEADIEIILQHNPNRILQ